MRVLPENEWSPPEEKFVWFKCPGCGDPHHLPTAGKRAWTFNGDFNKPTLRPSILYRAEGYTDPETGEVLFKSILCHSFVTDGRIEFLGDCSHALKGQTVDLKDVE